MKTVVFGGAGLVGSRFIEVNKDNFEIVAPTQENLDFSNIQETKKLLEIEKPESVINFAAVTNVEEAEDERGNKEGLVFKINATAVGNLAVICQELGIHIIHISTEYVFNGQKNAPYTEADTPDPINWYGETKYWGEQLLQEKGDSYTIIRIAMPFSANYDLKKDIARIFLDRLQKSQEIIAVTDSDITPVFVDDVANAFKVILEKKPQGIYHIVSTTSTTPFKFATAIAEEFGLDKSLIKEISFEEYNKNKKAKLLKHSWLSPKKFISEFGNGILHSVEESIELLRK